jgi:hypothetical protein
MVLVMLEEMVVMVYANSITGSSVFMLVEEVELK